MSNIDEVNRLLAEKDSSSDDEDNLGGLSRDTYMDKLYASSKQQKPAPQVSHRAVPQAVAPKTNDRFMAGTTAQELLDAVSSDSSDAEMEAIINSRLKKATTADRHSAPGSKAEETKNTPGGSGGGAIGAKNAEYYEKNWSDPSEREKFILNELGAISSSSDEDGDHELSTSAQNRRTVDKSSIGKSQKVAGGHIPRSSNTKQAVSQVRQRPVAIVEYNEKLSQHTPDKIIEAASQLLSFDKEFYNVKKELLIYSTFQQITRSLYEESDHPYFGLVSCVRMFRAKNGTVIFVGNSSGYIRVFDVQTQRSMKPLYDNKFFQTKVLCIDISEDGHYLLAGYKKGILALWDSAKFKIAHVMTDVAKSEASDFSMVKLLYTNDRNEMSIVTAEESGRIRLVHISKTLFGSFSHKANSLYESDLKGAATISVQRPSTLPSHYSMFCDMSCLVAFGATNMITIVEMRAFPPRPLKTIKRPAVCKEKSVPAIDWGYGLTPKERERTLPLLVFAWDKIIQLAYVDEATRTLEFDGFYCSDQEINQVYFMADSVLVILVGREEVKVLYTDKFQPGDVSMLGINKPAEELCINRDFKQIVEGTKASEIETGHVIRDIKPGVVSYASDAIGNDAQRQLLKVINFNNTICQYKKNIIILGTNKIYRARLLSWREYIDKLKFTDNHDWLTVLKVALEIYNGEIKGFALLPDATERRRSFLKDYMKKLILTSIQTVIFKFKSNTEASQSDSTHHDSDESYEDNFSIDKIAIKVSIEFCLQISEVEYLFTEVYQFFAEKDLEDKFIMHLCAPIIAGQFRSEVIPEYILQKLVRMYEDRQEFKVLEKIILNVNVDAYQQNAVGDVANHGKGIRAYLTVVCKSHCMVSALLQLQTSDRSDRQKSGCSQILNMLLGNMEIQKAMAEQNELIGSGGSSPTRKVQKNDMQLLKTADKHRKYEIEQSAVYIGYKLLWILSLFLKGKKFPTGELDEQQFLTHVLNIVDFVVDEQTLAQLLDFDAESFFQVMLLLFLGKPWKLIANCSNKDYLFEFQKAEITPGAASLGLGNSGKSTGSRILEFLKEAAFRTNRKEPELAQAAFHDLILSIVVGQDSEQKEKRQDREMGLAQRGIHPSHSHSVKEQYKKLEIDYELILAALKNVLSRKEPSEMQLFMGSGASQESAQTAHETCLQLVVDTVRCTKVKADDIDDIIGLILPTTQLQLIRVKIQLFENKQDYVEAFMLHVNNDQLKKGLFKWLTETLAALTKEDMVSRREKETKVEKKKEAKKEFEAGKFQKQNLIEDSSEEEEAASARPVSIALTASNDEYQPLAFLKSAVKQRILELAQLNSEQTVQLVETYLSDGDFQERLIMDKFSDFEEEQLSYLTNYISKNEKDIEATMREDFSAAHQTAARKYEKYLVLFTKLLCKFQKNQVEQWVSKSYFPPDKCLLICKEYGNLRGLAILTMRSGKPRDAISVYLEILSGFPMYKLIDQLKLLHKHHRPSFLAYIDEEGSSDQEVRNYFLRGTDDRRNYFVPEQVVLFEQVLGKACTICNADDLDSDQRMEAWFQILRYLQTFMVESFNKVTAAFKASQKAHVDVLKEADKTKYIMQLKDFIMDRINYILRYPGLDIPLKVLVEQLNLTFEQIKDLCSSKLRHNGTTLRIENCQRVLINSQLIDLFQDTVDKMSGGYCVEPNKRLVASKRQPGKRTIKGNTICNQCMSSIVRTRMAEPLVIFQCNHQFHSSCLTEKQKELSVGRKCPICLKQNYLAIKEEREKLEQRQRKRVGRRPGGARQQQQADATDDEGDGASSTAETSRNERSFVEPEPLVSANSESLMMRKMEQFDGLLDEVSLGFNEFQEAMTAK